MDDDFDEFDMAEEEAEPCVYMLRCPRHNACYVCDTMESAGAPLEAFLDRHMACGNLESFENGHLMGLFTSPGLPN